MNKKAIPLALQSILWSSDIKDLDLEKNKNYIINQVLIYGTFKEISWLYKTYGKPQIIRIFLDFPSKSYPAFMFNFVKNYLLGLSNKSLDENAYVTSIHGPIKPRTATSI